MEAYGKEASRYTFQSLKGKKVWLQKDVSETDRYGRDLRIVWLEVPSDDFEINAVQKGTPLQKLERGPGNLKV
ncbi:thermonuclease family protein [Bacillus infantis]|uniref:thermonuclease family protein n=1 Tax=Bacillus infantis TaxID=324767 RepID=UPI00296F8127|nr:thermonuclease family protein [Bacillus infantis]